ncbi:hypothetical protein CHUAL_008023 [Chamberlinius hualienensis]
MAKIVECVPNFSEGRNKDIIDAISNAISSTHGAALLDVDPGKSTNRTVYTFVGSPDVVVQAALNAARVAWKLIDMRKQKGEHPRMGALDVCPFIPVRGVTVEDCINCAKQFGERLSADLGVPVYLYGEASVQSHRKTLPQIRDGEYEGLPDKLKLQEWKPDFGSTDFVANWGATATGARKFLIAYNVNILGTKEQAHRIALNIREQGRGPNEKGNLKNCQAIGWWLEEHNIAQVSMNLTDFDVTPIHVAFEEAKKEAEKLNVAVAGSEIVGLVPLRALLQAAEFYIAKENLFVLEEDQKIHLAASRLGLNAFGTFDPHDRIIEYNLTTTTADQLVGKTVNYFIHSVAARTAAPGGGSVTALVGSLGAALGTMVGLMTYGKKQWESLDQTMREIIPIFHKAVKDIIPFIDADTDAFNDYLEALRLPKNTSDLEIAREEAIQESLKETVNVPLNLAKTIGKLWPSLKRLAEFGNINTKSDMQVSARCLETSVWGAYYNVRINLDNITDEEFKKKALKEIKEELGIAEKSRDEILKILEERN